MKILEILMRRSNGVLLSRVNEVLALTRGTGLAVEELTQLARDYLNAGHWCEAVVVGQRDSGGGFVWMAQSARLREGEATAIPLECMHAMHVNAVVAQGPCVLEDFYVGNKLMFRGGGRLVVHDCLVQPGSRIVVNLRGRLGPP